MQTLQSVQLSNFISSMSSNTCIGQFIYLFIEKCVFSKLHFTLLYPNIGSI